MTHPTLTVAAVARRLGVAPATLRTWDRRYGIGPGGHSSGSHRRYTDADLARLEVMRRLVLEGVSPAEAARVATTTPLGEAGPSASVPGPAPATRGGRGGGGPVVPVPGAEPAARGLARAAMALDAPAVRGIADQALARHGTLWAWDQLFRPVLVGVGERWEATGQGVEVEHLLSQVVGDALAAVAERAPAPTSPRPVLAASAEGELHSLPTVAVAAALAERQVAVRRLGPMTPRGALAAAVRRVGPAAVFVWSQNSATADLGQLDAVPTTRPPAAVVVGGPGWPADLGGRAVLVRSLSEAVQELVAAVSVRG